MRDSVHLPKDQISDTVVGSLQHYFSYSPAIPTAVQKAFNIPESWKCTAIIPFGEHGP